MGIWEVREEPQWFLSPQQLPKPLFSEPRACRNPNWSVAKAMTNISYQFSKISLSALAHISEGNCACMHTHTHTQIHSKKVPSAELSAQSLSSSNDFFFKTLQDWHVPGLNVMARGFPVSLLILVHKHQGRTLTTPFPRFAADSYQNLHDIDQTKKHRSLNITAV